MMILCDSLTKKIKQFKLIYQKYLATLLYFISVFISYMYDFIYHDCYREQGFILSCKPVLQP